MGLWRIGADQYGECETWIPDRGHRLEWPAESDIPPCDICAGELKRRRFVFTGKDKQEHSGYRYNLTHFGKAHDRHRTVYTEQRSIERRRAS
jgi:hypothetical protein